MCIIADFLSLSSIHCLVVVIFFIAYLQVVDDSKGKVGGGALATKVGCSCRTGLDGLDHSIRNHAGLLIQSQVTEHHDCRQDHG